MGIFGNRRRTPVQPVAQPQGPQKPKPDNENCEIKVKRDAHGRIINVKSSGKCTKEDRAIFARENNIPPESLEE